MTKTLQSNQQSELDAESVPSSLRIVCDDASSINLQAAEAAEEGKPALRKFSMVAYTGGAMRLGGWPYPVVVDLAGMRVTRKSRPILKDHDRAQAFNEVFGLMGITSASAIGKTVTDTKKLLADLKKSNGIADKTARDMDAGIGGAFRILKVPSKAWPLRSANRWTSRSQR